MTKLTEQLREALDVMQRNDTDITKYIKVGIELLNVLLPQILPEYEKLEREAAEYNNFKALIGVYEHERIIEMLRNNKDFPQAASHIMKEQYERQKMLRTQKLEREVEISRMILKDLGRIPPFHEYIDALAFTDASGAWDCFVKATEKQIAGVLTAYRAACER